MPESSMGIETRLSQDVQQATDSNARGVERLGFSGRAKVLAGGIWDLARNTASGAVLLATGLGAVHGGIVLGKGFSNFGEDLSSVVTGRKRTSGLQGIANKFSKGNEDITSFKRNTIN